MINLENFRAILFDLDGTLIDSWPTVRDAYKQALSKLKPGVNQEHIELLRNDNREYQEAIKFVFKANDRIKLYEETVANIYMQDLPHKTEIFSGVNEVINYLNSIQKPWGIVTNKKKGFVEKILNAKPIFTMCRVLICAEDVEYKKPSPEGLLKACEILSVTPNTALYVGDLESDIIAARKAGLESACVLSGYCDKHEALLLWHADYYFNSIRELCPI